MLFFRHESHMHQYTVESITLTKLEVMSKQISAFMKIVNQSEHIGQWATPHHDRRLGGIGRVVPIG